MYGDRKYLFNIPLSHPSVDPRALRSLPPLLHSTYGRSAGQCKQTSCQSCLLQMDGRGRGRGARRGNVRHYHDCGRYATLSTKVIPKSYG